MRTKYCSRACQAVGQHERRSRKRSNAPVERVRSEVVFARDRWMCHLCGKKINRKLRDQHPLMASLDHIIPVNDPGYPGHVWENLAAAHLRCNIAKSDKADLADWVLYETLAAQRRHNPSVTGLAA
jgi:5-methylcytosine-specific restriction endonuclease McrA